MSAAHAAPMASSHWALPPLASEFVSSGVSVGAATCFTAPIDMVKTRMQLQHLQGGRPQGLLATTAAVVRTEGAPALWRGLSPALARGLVYGGLRLGLYSPAKAALGADGADGGPSFARKLLAGSLSGGVAAAVSSPTELVKTRLQAHGCTARTSGEVFRQVVAEDGVRGLWKGATPGLVRAAVLTASQCATYDEVKQRVMAAFGWGDCAATHLVTSMVTGLVSTTATNGIDVVKVNMFVRGGAYSGPLACAADVWAREGAAGFMRGWTANYARLGPQTVIAFTVAEQLRALMGLKAF